MSQSTLTNIPPGEGAGSPVVIGDKYRVARLLGEGGMGSVYEAENTWTRRRVAVKVMRPEFTRDHESVQRFLREAQTAAQIEHPNIVQVLDMGRDAMSGSYFIVQEFLVGQDLRALLDERQVIPSEEALEYMLPVMDGLIVAHAQGVVHRDLKPENIFMLRTRSGRVYPKVIDFGIAKALKPRESDFRTMVAQTMGTPGYMSPEQARGDLDIDARTDVWSIGVVLFEMLSGRMPYEHDDNPQIMLAMVIMRDPISLNVVAPGLPQELRNVIGKALQRDRNARYSDMQAFYDALAETTLGAKARDTLRKAAQATEVQGSGSLSPPVPAPSKAPESVSLSASLLPPGPAPAVGPLVADAGFSSQEETVPLLPTAPARRGKLLWWGVGLGVSAILAAVGLYAATSPATMSVAPPSTSLGTEAIPSAPSANPSGQTGAPATRVAPPGPSLSGPDAGVGADADLTAPVSSPRDASAATPDERARRGVRRRPRQPQRGTNGAAIVD